MLATIITTATSTSSPPPISSHSLCYTFVTQYLSYLKTDWIIFLSISKSRVSWPYSIAVETIWCLTVVLVDIYHPN